MSKSQKPENKKFWCPKCDEALIIPGQKCGLCGHRLSPHIKEYSKKKDKSEKK